MVDSYPYVEYPLWNIPVEYPLWNIPVEYSSVEYSYRVFMKNSRLESCCL